MTKNSMNRYIGNILFESIHKDHGFWYQVTDVDVDQDSGECFFKAKQIWEDKNNDTSQKNESFDSFLYSKFFSVIIGEVEPDHSGCHMAIIIISVLLVIALIAAVIVLNSL